MFRWLITALWLCALAPLCHAQLPSHKVSLSKDSIWFNNSPYRFTEIIDARFDTTKLGFLKEGFDASTYQILQLPEPCERYVFEYIRSAVKANSSAQDVAIVMHHFNLTEEPLGAIEITKAQVHFSFYLVENKKYRKIREVNTRMESPAKEVTEILSEQLKTTLHGCLTDFMKKPTSEGEDQSWVNRADLLKKVMPTASLKVAPVGELDYAQRKFWLNGERIDKKEALRLLENTEDEEILSHISKFKSHGVYSTALISAGALVVGYTVGTYIGSGDELNGIRLIAAMGGFVPGLLTAKSRRHHMHQAVELFNSKYNR